MEVKNNLQDIEGFRYVVRFINFPKLLDFIVSGSFYFARLDSFNDKSEAISKQQLIKHLYPKQWSSEPEKKELDLITRQKRYFATCWFGSNRESFAMWNLYSDSSSVAFKYDFDVFNSLWNEDNIELNISKNWINRLYVDKISYIDYLDGQEIFKKKKNIMGLVKDKSYVDEKEVRVLFKCNGMIHKGKLYERKISDADIKAIKVSLTNFKKIPLTILFHPEMKETHKKNIRLLIAKYGYKNIKCKNSELTKLLNFDGLNKS